MSRFHLYRAARIELLSEQFVALVRAHRPIDPLEPITVVVGSRGMEHWLRHQLAVALGICAQFLFPFPGQALGQVYQKGPGMDGDSRSPPNSAAPTSTDVVWTPEGMAWSILTLLPEFLTKPEFKQLAAWLRREPKPGVLALGSVGRDRWSLAREVADVLDRASLFRPDWIEAWDREATPAATPAWLGILWRALRLKNPNDPPTLLLQTASPKSGSPIYIFGVTSMPPLWIDAWKRASQVRDIHLFHLTPSEMYWGDVLTGPELRRPSRSLNPEDQRKSQHPLLTALGRVARDSLDLLLADGEFPLHDVDVSGGFSDIDPVEPSTLLQYIQSDLAVARSESELRELRATRILDESDDSIQFYATHGPTRQVETLREALLDLMDRHPDIELRDIVVMTPKLGQYAPLIQYIFGEGLSRRGRNGWGPTGGPKLPVHIADLGLRFVNPLAETLLRTIALASNRLLARDILDFSLLPPVRRRFELEDSDLEHLRVWLRDAGARWGADSAERQAQDTPAQHLFTVAFALDRLAFGVTTIDNKSVAFADTAPYDEMEGDAVESFGQLAEMCARIQKWRNEVLSPRPVAQWAADLLLLTDDLAAPAEGSEFQRSQLAQGLRELVAEAGDFSGMVSLETISMLLSDRFEYARSGDRPATGAITVCALTPMRSVPFRVVALLGMDDGAFPRTPPSRSFDATVADKRLGDRDPRDEDRNLFLETLLAARGHFLVFYTGHDPSTGTDRAPAVPVGDLLDLVDETCSSTPGCKLRPRDLLTRQPSVQPFLPSGFTPSTAWPSPRQAARFDGRMFDAATFLAGERGGVPPFLDFDESVPDPNPPRHIDVDRLIAWIQKPVRRLVQERVGLYLDASEAELAERETLEPDILARMDIARAIVAQWLNACAKGYDAPAPDPQTLMEDSYQTLRIRGALPPGTPGRLGFEHQWSVGRAVWRCVVPDTIPLNDAEPELPGQIPQAIRHDISVASGTIEVMGSVAVHGGEILDLGLDDPSTPRRIIGAWIRLLALSASGHPIRHARIVGMGSREPKAITLTVPENATAQLGDLVSLFLEARTRVIRLFEKTSHAFACALHANSANPQDALKKASTIWTGSEDRPGEIRSNALKTIAGDRLPFEDEEGAPHPAFENLAVRLWNPIFRHGGAPTRR